MTDQQDPAAPGPADVTRAPGRPAVPGPVPRPTPGPPVPRPPRVPGPPTPAAPAAAPDAVPAGDDHPTDPAATDPAAAPDAPRDDAPGDDTSPDAGGGVPSTATFPPVASAGADPARWGRVDAEGTVWLTAGGEDRAVGSWQAGDAAEGLAHFARRFDDLRTEVDLLVRRLQSGRGDARATRRSAGTLREGLDSAAVVGDVPGLTARIDAVVEAAGQAGEAERAARAGARDEAVARKEALIAEAGTLAGETTRWKHAGDRFAEMLEEWKAVAAVDRKTDDALWKRFAKAREAFTRRRGAHFAEMDRVRSVARTRKEELVTEAEALAGSEDWAVTAGRYRDLMTEWKAAGRTSKDVDDALWARFRGAQDGFFARRSETFDARDAEFAENARAKEALLVEAGRLDVTDLDAARAALRDLQDRWDAVGKVPRERVGEFAAGLKEVEDRVRTASDRRWQATDPETEARVAQFRERVATFEAQAGKARAAGDRRRAEEAERQATQWREWLAAAERATTG